MNYVLDAVLIIVGLVFLVVGVRRGPLAEGLALGAIVLGALLMAEWGDVWGIDLAETIPLGSAGVTRFIVWLALLIAPVLIIGYGGSVLLPRLAPMRAWQRALGGLLGLVNGAALAAFVLRAWYYTGDRNATSGLLADPVAVFFLNWAGWWPLVILLGGVGAVLAGLVSGAFRPRRTTPPLVRPAPPGSPAVSSPASITPPEPARPRPAPEPSISGSPVAPTRPVPVVPSPPPAPAPAAPSYTVAPPTAPATNGTGNNAPVAPATAAVGLRCRTCGKALLPGAAFCTNCGTPVEV